MKSRAPFLLVLFLAATAAAQNTALPTALSESLRKVTARYARTEERIQVLVGRRLNPPPLPAEMPNPFYQGVELSELATLPEPETPLVPDAPDITDADTLARIVPTLRITGLVIRNQQPHLTINSVSCKPGDIIAIPGRATPLFIQVRRIADGQLTLGLNDAEVTIPLKL